MHCSRQTQFSNALASSLSKRLSAAANGDHSWRGDLLREAAKAIEAGTAETQGSVHESAVAESHSPNAKGEL